MLKMLKYKILSFERTVKPTGSMWLDDFGVTNRFAKKTLAKRGIDTWVAFESAKDLPILSIVLQNWTMAHFANLWLSFLFFCLAPLEVHLNAVKSCKEKLMSPLLTSSLS